ncbi:MAG: SpvB/TcaC N-terminal domain-containing protein [Alphaproteobacteria bacterium]
MAQGDVKAGEAQQAAISLPKGGGAIAGIGESFQPNLFTGAGQFTVPIATSPGRGGVHPELALQYSAGHGNGPFGLGWALSLPQIRRKTEKGLPHYAGDDVFVLSGAEDLVPVLDDTGTRTAQRIADDGAGERFSITRYRPRTEGLFARIERWEQAASADHQKVGAIHWRVTTRENVTSIYGRTAAARIDGDGGHQQTFAWLIEETFDAKGNHIAYEYAKDADDLAIRRLSERNRRYRQRYLRRIYYGNIPEPAGAGPLTYADGTPVGHARIGVDHLDPLKPRPRRYAFELLFDYGDLETPDDQRRSYAHKPPTPAGSVETFGEATSDPSAVTPVPVREDPFSTFRAGFEIRTLRLCRRTLMIHHFAELDGPTLVKATRFDLEREPASGLSFLRGATLIGYRKKQDGSYHLPQGMPAVTFTYQPFDPAKRRYRPIEAEGGELPPRSLADPSTALIDVFGDGLPDVVQSTAAGFRYWRNLGDGRLDRPRLMAESPAGFNLGDPGVAIGDLSGDGSADLIVARAPLAGFFEMSPSGGWRQSSFKHFHQQPSIDPADPSARLLDLSGDGLSDILVTTAESLVWFRSLGEEGFDQGRVIPRDHDLDSFPDVHFDDPSGRVRLADMSGDGLVDIVHLHSGRIDYWPNLGHGRFGRRITMEGSPLLPPHADPKRLFLADLDGSGTADLVHVEDGLVRYWLNRSGNGWSEEQTVRGTPRVGGSTTLHFADLFGTGTATLVWSEDFGVLPGANYRALDFCGGEKPYLLTEMSNNLGATTTVTYASSTRFYLEDLDRGEPWATALPFPVQVVERVETIDHVADTRHAAFYRYRHGYFDGREREFRGFGRVDQTDAEQLFDGDAVPGMFDLPPAETRSWFHTGAVVEEREIAERYRAEYWNGDPAAFTAPANELKLIGSDAETRFEAVRALRGSIMRTELYGRDGSAHAAHPYSITESCYQIRELQTRKPEADAVNGVFLSTPKTSLTYHYERNPADPRISQSTNLPVDAQGHLTDAFGNVTDSLKVAYPRRTPDPDVPEQATLDILYSKQDVINRDPNDGSFRYVGVGAQSRSYEIRNVAWPKADPKASITAQDVAALMADPDDAIAFEQPFAAAPAKKLIAWSRSYFRKDSAAGDLDPSGSAQARLPLLQIDRLGLPYETYQASLTDSLILDLFGERAPGQPRIAPALPSSEGGYVRLPGISGYWWAPSGRQAFDAGRHYQPTDARDPFGNIARRQLDRHGLLAERSSDPLGNSIEVLNDYQTLQPFLMKDPNGNVSEVAFDPLGMVVGTAVMGKAGRPPSQTILGLDVAARTALIASLRANSEADSLDGFDVDLLQPAAPGTPAAVRRQRLRSLLADPDGGQAAYSASALRPVLAKATSRILYDLHAFAETAKPAVTAVVKRERHAAADASPPLQVSYGYTDGFGREVQSALQAEPAADGKRRWVVSGWTIFNNKGSPVQRFEPSFSDRQAFQANRKAGVTATLFYDPLQRAVATLLPERGYEKVRFDPWRQMRFDASDTVLLDPRTDGDVKGLVAGFVASLGPSFQTWHQQRSTSADVRLQQAASKSAAHADTPAITHLDHRGREVLAIAHNRRGGVDQDLATRTAYDIKGEVVAITDPRQHDANAARAANARVRTFRYRHDLLARQLQTVSIDAGDRSAFLDVQGNPIRAFDTRGNSIETRYDALRRPLEIWVEAGGSRRLSERFAYGEGSPNDTGNNRRGRIHKIQDGAGEIENERFDIKGNLEASTRRLPVRGDLQPDWQTAVPLESDVYRTTRTHDALSRAVSVTTPDGSVTRPTYNPANLLEAVTVAAHGQAAKTLVTAVDYNARGQRSRIAYGNGVETAYSYDDDTFRLIETISRRTADNVTLLHCDYVHDAVGNVTSMRDHAAQTIHFNNQVVAPDADYSYDALNRLIDATGREHLGAGASGAVPDGPDGNGRFGHAHPHDGQAMRRYRRSFDYDKAGNIEAMRHHANGGSWTRHYAYQAASNRLRSTSLPSDATPDDPTSLPDRYSHDADGNITAMPHLGGLVWDHRGRLVEADLGGGGKAFYHYAGDGMRIRKTVIKGGVTEERLYLGGFEIFRTQNASGLQHRRETLDVMDDQRRIAMIEMLTHDNGAAVAAPSSATRFQLADQVESVSIELNDQGQVITYEIFYPYGGTAFHAARSAAGLSQKRYRFNGKERDEETGLYDYGARYYAPWLGRWMSCDPTGASSGVNLYRFAACNPIRMIDPNGCQEVESNQLPQTDQRPPSTAATNVHRSIDQVLSQAPPAIQPKTKAKPGPTMTVDDDAVAYDITEFLISKSDPSAVKDKGEARMYAARIDTKLSSPSKDRYLRLANRDDVLTFDTFEEAADYAGSIAVEQTLRSPYTDTTKSNGEVVSSKSEYGGFIVKIDGKFAVTKLVEGDHYSDTGRAHIEMKPLESMLALLDKHGQLDVAAAFHSHPPHRGEPFGRSGPSDADIGYLAGLEQRTLRQSSKLVPGMVVTNRGDMTFYTSVSDPDDPKTMRNRLSKDVAQVNERYLSELVRFEYSHLRQRNR